MKKYLFAFVLALTSMVSFAGELIELPKTVEIQVGSQPLIASFPNLISHPELGEIKVDVPGIAYLERETETHLFILVKVGKNKQQASIDGIDLKRLGFVRVSAINRTDSANLSGTVIEDTPSVAYIIGLEFIKTLAGERFNTQCIPALCELQAEVRIAIEKDHSAIHFLSYTKMTDVWVRDANSYYGHNERRMQASDDGEVIFFNFNHDLESTRQSRNVIPQSNNRISSGTNKE